MNIYFVNQKEYLKERHPVNQYFNDLNVNFNSISISKLNIKFAV